MVNLFTPLFSQPLSVMIRCVAGLAMVDLQYHMRCGAIVQEDDLSSVGSIFLFSVQSDHTFYMCTYVCRVKSMWHLNGAKKNSMPSEIATQPKNPTIVSFLFTIVSFSRRPTL